jgi:DNA uptake protein ComE-like DNA-binding protein
VTLERWFCVATAACIVTGVVVAAMAAAANPDLQAVQAVCGRCHTIDVFLNKPRSWDRWNYVFEDMTQRGARGTDEQLERVTRFFLENLTLVNINTSAAEELAGVLGVSEDVAQDLIARRQRQRFSSIDQLRAVPGVDIEKVKERKSRIEF